MLTVNEFGLYSLIFTSRKPEAKRFRKWVTSEVLPAIRQTGRYCGYSANDPDPVVVWAKLLGVRTSDVITKGFGVGYLLGGPIHPSDYLAHNHRVLCHAVTGLASCWPGLHEFRLRSALVTARMVGKGVRLQPSDRRLARQSIPGSGQSPTLIRQTVHFS